jgi:hypothetical protein
MGKPDIIVLDIKVLMEQLGICHEFEAWVSNRPMRELPTSEIVQPSQKQ